jgi:hypothetical protein
MTEVCGLLKTPTASKSELGSSRGVNSMGRKRRFLGLRKPGWVNIGRIGFCAAVLVLGGTAAGLGENRALADEGILKGPMLLTFLVTQDERTVAIWGPDVSEEPAEIVTGNKVLLPVPAGMVEEIKAIVSDPGGFPDGILQYVIVLRGGSSTKVCHTQNGNFHCHPPS